MLEYLHLFTAASWGLRPWLQNTRDAELPIARILQRDLLLGLTTFAHPTTIYNITSIDKEPIELSDCIQAYCFSDHGYFLTSKGELYSLWSCFELFDEQKYLYLDQIRGGDCLLAYTQQGKVLRVSEFETSITALNSPADASAKFLWLYNQVICLSADGRLMVDGGDTFFLELNAVDLSSNQAGRLVLILNDGTTYDVW